MGYCKFQAESTIYADRTVQERKGNAFLHHSATTIFVTILAGIRYAVDWSMKLFRVSTVAAGRITTDLRTDRATLAVAELFGTLRNF